MNRILLNFVLAAALCASALAGQSAAFKSSPMVGTWKMVLDPKMLKDMPKGTKLPQVSMQFKANGTMTGTMKMDKKVDTMQGVWTLKGSTLTMRQTHENGKPKKDAKAESVTLSKDKRSFMIPGSNGMGKFVKV